MRGSKLLAPQAELRPEGATYWDVDIESTNGSGERPPRQNARKLEPGDTFTVRDRAHVP